VLVCREPVGHFGQISAAASTELGQAVAAIESALAEAFAFDRINYLMLMMVDPNVHFHVIPRYSQARSACGLTIADPGWPAMPQLGEAQDISPDERDALRALISEYW